MSASASSSAAGPTVPLQRRGLWRFRWPYALAALVIFAIEAGIATIGNDIPWLRWYAGDVIVVGFVHCLLAMVINASPTRIALGAFAISCGVEFSQYLAHVYGWVIHNRVLRVIVGSTADWGDLACYALGLVVILLLIGLHAVWRRRALA